MAAVGRSLHHPSVGSRCIPCPAAACSNKVPRFKVYGASLVAPSAGAAGGPWVSSSWSQRSGVVLAAAASANPGDDGHLASDQQTSTSSSGYHLILYSKPNCSLCDGLKERVRALIVRADFMPCSLTGATLEVRDITTRPEWEQEFAMAVPVLAVDLGGSTGEVQLPRPAPRMPVERLQKLLEDSIAAAAADPDA